MRRSCGETRWGATGTSLSVLAPLTKLVGGRQRLGPAGGVLQIGAQAGVPTAEWGIWLDRAV